MNFRYFHEFAIIAMLTISAGPVLADDVATSCVAAVQRDGEDYRRIENKCDYDVDVVYCSWQRNAPTKNYQGRQCGTGTVSSVSLRYKVISFGIDNSTDQMLLFACRSPSIPTQIFVTGSAITARCESAKEPEKAINAPETPGNRPEKPASKPADTRSWEPIIVR